MPKKSVRDNKNIYQKAREDAGLTREKASDSIGFMSPSVIEKIEYDQTKPDPEEVLAMAKAYKKMDLCNYYCSHECSIGNQYVQEVKITSRIRSRWTEGFSVKMKRKILKEDSI